MVKVIRNISIDTEILFEAQQRTENLSATIQDLLSNWIKTTAEIEKKNEMEELKRDLKRKEIELANLHQKLKENEEKSSKNRIIRVIS